MNRRKHILIIDIFNSSNKFFSDLCYYFESPNNKDTPLKDRIASFFPNITLCDLGCKNDVKIWGLI